MSVLHPAYMDFLIAGLLSEGFIKSRMKFYDSAAMEDMGLVKRDIKHRNVLGSFLYGDAFFNQVEQIIIRQKFFKRFTFRHSCLRLFLFGGPDNFRIIYGGR